MPRYLKKPAAWYRDLVAAEKSYKKSGDDFDAIVSRRNRLLEEKYISDSIKLLRQYSSNFGTKQGFDLKKLRYIPESRLEDMKMYASILRAQLATPHILVRPRDELSKQALIAHTGQDDIPGRTVFAVHTMTPDKTKIRVVKSTVVEKKRGKKIKRQIAQVETTQAVKGGEVLDRYFYLSDYSDKKPTTFKQIIAITKKMLKDMPKGYYTLITSAHGNIAAPIVKELLMSQLRSRFALYDLGPAITGRDQRGLAETVLGYKYISYRSSAAGKEYADRLDYRAKAKKQRARERERERRHYLKGRL